MKSKKINTSAFEDFDIDEEDIEREEELDRQDPDRLLPVDGTKEYWDELGKNDSFKEKTMLKIRVFFSRIRHMWYDLTNGIASCWRWKKVIWNDRTWGYSNIVDVLIFKLKIDREAFLKNDHTTSTAEMTSKMLEVITLLERWRSHDYYEKYRKAHDEKWGEDRTYFVKLRNGASLWKSERDDRLTEAEKEQESREFSENTKKAEQEKQHDLDVAFQIMTQELESWWD